MESPYQPQMTSSNILRHHPLFILESSDLGLMKTSPAHIQVADNTPCRNVLYRYPEKARDNKENDRRYEREKT